MVAPDVLPLSKLTHRLRRHRLRRMAAAGGRARRFRACSKTPWRRLDGSARRGVGRRTDRRWCPRAGQVASMTLRRDIYRRGADARAERSICPLAVRVLVQPKRSAPTFTRASSPSQDLSVSHLEWRGAEPVRAAVCLARAWPVLDGDAMAAAAARLIGRHDFAAFQATGSKRADHRADGVLFDRCAQAWIGRTTAGSIAYEVRGDGFLRHMVRTIAGTLVEVGRGRRPPSWMTKFWRRVTAPSPARTAPGGRAVSGRRSSTDTAIL